MMTVRSVSPRVLRWFSFAVFAAILTAPAPGVAQTAGASADAQAILISPVALTEITRIDFGSIMLSGNAGQVLLSPAGEVTTRGVIVGDRSRARSGTFRMRGGVGQTYVISLPPTVTFFNGDTVRITRFTHDAGDTPMLSGNGAGGFNIGATLMLGAGQPSGIYDGNMIVIISNN